ncbi:MAG: DEAD/DEAH box helicase family protein [Alkaliphilus sp.]
MSLKQVHIEKEYRTFTRDLAKEFYIPLLSESVEYKRAVGFFSSTALIQVSYGISELIANDGKIKLIASPKLSEEDVVAIERGYDLREKIIGDALLRELYFAENFYDEQRLNLLAHLITDGILDIKIAMIDSETNIGIYHEKMGIFSDSSGNKVAFTGSMNESLTAMKLNYESIDVYCSWTSENDRVLAKENAFNRIWDNLEANVEVRRFPEVEKEIIKRFYNAECDFKIDATDLGVFKNKKKQKKWIEKPEHMPKYYDYQKQAVDSWEANNFRGIYDMATGTGKTLAALGSLERLSERLDEHLYIIIVCPYQHLVEQWLEDIRAYGINPLVCYSSYNWKRKFKESVVDYELGLIKNYCVITTNATFATDYFQEIVKELKINVCIVVDEAHNFGAKRQQECMLDLYSFRLALSATLERHRDEIGTAKLCDFFGKKCIEYTLEMAIKAGKLTPYFYYPVPIVLDEDEYEEYMKLTAKIVKSYGHIPDDDNISKGIEMLLIKRARIVAGARAKLTELFSIIQEKYTDSNQMLIYCGATNVNFSIYEEGSVDDDEKRQIEIVLDLLGNKLGMRVAKFTSEENKSKREQIKDKFSKGNMLQAVVAIRCLDEGVNIPGIKTAFLLASSTNPKEYIQRRGRVLRKATSKHFATIYDFVTLPRSLKKPNSRGADKYEIALIRREFERIKEFSRLSENPSDSERLMEEVNKYYEIY